MATIPNTLKLWFEAGIYNKATHMIVVTDTFSWEDYPVYVSEQENVHEIAKKYNYKNMQKVTEVYNLSMTWEEQSGHQRVFNY